MESAYKHRQIASFQVKGFVKGKEILFKFKDGILRIKTDDENEAFLDAWEGMEPQDKNNIIKLKEVENETPIQSRTTRQALSTDFIPDSVKAESAKAGDASALDGLDTETGTGGAEGRPIGSLGLKFQLKPPT